MISWFSKPTDHEEVPCPRRYLRCSTVSMARRTTRRVGYDWDTPGPEHLLAVLSQVPDPRDARGMYHGLPKVLAMAIAAVLAGKPRSTRSGNGSPAPGRRRYAPSEPGGTRHPAATSAPTKRRYRVWAPPPTAAPLEPCLWRCRP